ncbi:right-handed parallel beta-helix repeat-containing protein [Photobacterium sp. 53610]|uniref:right-handed parallel beta-helix repeat-containing protein n=1 Tax=Photobacterium sp. 53610 TaxID=3102789 RepID=UPI002ED8D8EB
MQNSRTRWKKHWPLLFALTLAGCGGGGSSTSETAAQDREPVTESSETGGLQPDESKSSDPVQPPANTVADQTIEVDGTTYTELEKAEAAIQPGSNVVIGNGIYTRGLEILRDNVTVTGSGNTHFRGAQLKDKATFIVDGDDVRIENIECSQVTVPDQNGACVRQQGRDLVLSRVFFHDSEQGILSAPGTGNLTIEHSRFERLGKAGRAHAVYSNNDSLTIRYSRFHSSKDEGHEIKSRAQRTLIEYSEIASINGDDSRLVDTPNGGELVIRNSVLEQGPNSSNRQLIGFGLESTYDATKSNRVTLENNVIVLDRQAGSQLLALPSAGGYQQDVRQNDVVGQAPVDKADLMPENTFYESRAKYGVDAFPALPDMGF